MLKCCAGRKAKADKYYEGVEEGKNECCYCIFVSLGQLTSTHPPIVKFAIIVELVVDHQTGQGAKGTLSSNSTKGSKCESL